MTCLSFVAMKFLTPYKMKFCQVAHLNRGSQWVTILWMGPQPRRYTL
jgi:hypothetical protein